MNLKSKSNKTSSEVNNTLREKLLDSIDINTCIPSFLAKTSKYQTIIKPKQSKNLPFYKPDHYSKNKAFFSLFNFTSFEDFLAKSFPQISQFFPGQNGPKTRSCHKPVAFQTQYLIVGQYQTQKLGCGLKRCLVEVLGVGLISFFAMAMNQ